MLRTRLLHVGLFATLFITFVSTIVYAQVPDWEIDLTEQEKDSLATAEYPYIFPLFGHNVVRRGFELPYPFGISISYYQHHMGVFVDQLALGVDESPLMPVDFFEFEDVTNKTRTINTRLDLWLFPFLNIYGMLGYVDVDAAVDIVAPFPLETAVEMDGWGYGAGGILAFGFNRFWITTDGNITWNDLDAYDDAVSARVVSFRLGRTFDLVKSDRLQFWLGAMYQNVDTEVAGSYILLDIITEDMYGLFADYQTSDWYNDLDPVEQGFVDALFAEIQAGDPTTVLNYQVQQHPQDNWNMLTGAQYEISKRWYFRVEAGFLGSRTQVLTNINYRFPL